MKAVVLREKGKLAVEEVPRPPLGEQEVMVRVTDCGICGSDIRYLHGENPWAQHTIGQMKPNPANIILGHEVVGVVDEVGDSADKSLLAKRVAVLCFRLDQTCPTCRHGDPELCPNTQHMGHGAGWGDQKLYYGGMAEYVPVWSDHVFPIPDHVGSADATLLDPLGVAVHAVNRAAPIPGESAVIVGTGVIGLLAVQVLRHFGATNIICADIDSRHLDLGLGLGADHSVNCREQDLTTAVMDLTNGFGARIIVDTVGRPLEEMLGALAPGGRYVNLAVHDREERINHLWLAAQKTITTAANFKYEEWPVTLDLLFSGRIQASPLITHKFPIEEAVQAFSIAERKEESGAIKVIINP